MRWWIFLGRLASALYNDWTYQTGTGATTNRVFPGVVQNVCFFLFSPACPCPARAGCEHLCYQPLDVLRGSNRKLVWCGGELFHMGCGMSFVAEERSPNGSSPLFMTQAIAPFVYVFDIESSSHRFFRELHRNSFFLLAMGFRRSRFGAIPLHALHVYIYI